MRRDWKFSALRSPLGLGAPTTHPRVIAGFSPSLCGETRAFP
jgi:hypothetical protein